MTDRPDPIDGSARGPIAPGGELGAAVAGLRTKAPRLRLAALILVGVAVAVMFGFALLAPDPATVVATVTPIGRVCVRTGNGVWESKGPVLPTADVASTIEGSWRVTADDAAELTTATGLVLQMRPYVHGGVACRI